MLRGTFAKQLLSAPESTNGALWNSPGRDALGK